MWRSDFFSLISETPHLTWLLLTKRIGNVRSLLPVWWEDPQAWEFCAPGANVWIGASIVNQEEAARDIPKLLGVPAVKRFISYEPALGPLSFEGCWVEYADPRIHENWLERLDWVIVGGESAQGGHDARPFVIGWARDVMLECQAVGTAFFMKQMGSNVVVEDATCPLERAIREGGYRLKHRAGADPSEWPEDLRVQEFPKGG